MGSTERVEYQQRISALKRQSEDCLREGFPHNRHSGINNMKMFRQRSRRRRYRQFLIGYVEDWNFRHCFLFNYDN